MKMYNTPEMEIKDLRAVAVLTLSDETEIINPFADDVDPADQ